MPVTKVDYGTLTANRDRDGIRTIQQGFIVSFDDTKPSLAQADEVTPQARSAYERYDKDGGLIETDPYSYLIDKQLELTAPNVITVTCTYSSREDSQFDLPTDRPASITWSFTSQ